MNDPRLEIGKLMRPIHRLGSDPVWQFHVHAFFTFVWALSMLVIPFIPPFAGFHNVPALLIMEVSLWANFATHFGAMSSALAGILSQHSAQEKEAEVEQNFG